MVQEADSWRAWLLEEEEKGTETATGGTEVRWLESLIELFTVNLPRQDFRDLRVEARFQQKRGAQREMHCEGYDRNSCYLLSLTAALSAENSRNR